MLIRRQSLRRTAWVALTSVAQIGAIGFFMARAPGIRAQQSSAGAPLGHLVVDPKVMAGRCLTQVSPKYPMGVDATSSASTVVVQAVVWQSGRVTPTKLISGDPAFAAEAMNAVRLWRYRPFVRDEVPMDVTTNITVEFVAGRQAGMVSHPHV